MKETKDKEIESSHVLKGEGRILSLSFTVMETEYKNLAFTVNRTTKFVPTPEPMNLIC